jgi:hypothetical protein
MLHLRDFVKVCNHPRLVLTPEHPDYAALLDSHLRGTPHNLLDIGQFLPPRKIDHSWASVKVNYIFCEVLRSALWFEN